MPLPAMCSLALKDAAILPWISLWVCSQYEVLLWSAGGTQSVVFINMQSLLYAVPIVSVRSLPGMVLCSNRSCASDNKFFSSQAVGLAQAAEMAYEARPMFHNGQHVFGTFSFGDWLAQKQVTALNKYNHYSKEPIDTNKFIQNSIWLALSG